MLGDSVSAIQEKLETILQANRVIGLEINAEKTKYIIIPHHSNLGQNQNIRIDNESFEKVVNSNTWGRH
jgi:hypothetical protein